MEKTPSQEIKTKIFEAFFKNDLEKKLSEFLSSEAMKEATVLDIKYSPYVEPAGNYAMYSAFVIYK